MNNIKKVINELETAVFKFTPNPEFYKTIGIKRKRFFQLLRNEKEPTIIELKAIALYFNVSFDKLINL